VSHLNIGRQVGETEGEVLKLNDELFMPEARMKRTHASIRADASFFATE